MSLFDGINIKKDALITLSLDKNIGMSYQGMGIMIILRKLEEVMVKIDVNINCMMKYINYPYDAFKPLPCGA